MDFMIIMSEYHKINSLAIDIHPLPCLIVSVKDAGDGMGPNILPKLFSKFARKSYHRTGLGLYKRHVYKKKNAKSIQLLNF